MRNLLSMAVFAAAGLMSTQAMADGLLEHTQTGMIARSDIAYHEYEGIATDLQERERLVADMGDKHVMIPVKDMRLAPVDDKRYVIVTRYTEEQLEALPSVDEGWWD